MGKFVLVVEKYIKRLENAKFANLEKTRIGILKNALSDGVKNNDGIIIPSIDFTGGGGSGMYSYKCPVRYGVWAYAQESVGLLSASFVIKNLKKDGDAALVLCAQDDDSENACAISVKINDYEVFKGKNPFPRFAWSLKTFKFPKNILKNGKNFLTIKNISGGDNLKGPPFFMINYAAVKQ
jgi:hypothetical protein